jgi:tRNA threonylcarbamoyladenosine biosynthesis protein TsaB
MQGFSIATPLPDAQPTILALDTTAGACSVALLQNGRCEQRIEPLGVGHSRRLLAMVQALLIPPNALDAIAFGAGPGSFTGLRVACGVAQGLGLGWDRPLVPVGSMATLAWLALRRPGPSLALVALDARMGEVYRSAWRRVQGDANRVERVLAAEAVAPQRAAEEFSALLGGERAAAAGDGFALGPLAQWLAGAPAVASVPDAVQPQAEAVAWLAAQAWRDGLAVDAADAAPVYVRDKVALDVDEQAALRASRARAVAPGSGR